MSKDQGFHSQGEAHKAAREAIWGTVHHLRREYVSPKTHADLAFWDHRGLPVIAVSANVNDRLVVIHFDGYGRLDHEGIVVLDRIGKGIA